MQKLHGLTLLGRAGALKETKRDTVSLASKIAFVVTWPLRLVAVTFAMVLSFIFIECVGSIINSLINVDLHHRKKAHSLLKSVESVFPSLLSKINTHSEIWWSTCFTKAFLDAELARAPNTPKELNLLEFRDSPRSSFS